jgi:hypothetical protein
MKVEIGQIVKRSRARSTGETIVVFYNGEKNWVVKSLETEQSNVYSTRRQAEIAMSAPEKWNEISAKIVSGELPKYDKSKNVVNA